MCRNGFFDKSVLYEVWLDDSKRFPPWRQRTGSGCLAWSLMCATTKTYWVTLKQTESIEKTRRKHGEPLRNTTSGLLPPGWNMVVVNWTITVQLPSKQNTRRRHHEHTTNHSQRLNHAYEPVKNKPCPVNPKVALLPVLPKPLDSR